MFGLGFSEILFLVVIFIVFIKPKDYPKIIKSVSDIYRAFMRFYYRCIDQLSDLY